MDQPSKVECSTCRWYDYDPRHLYGICRRTAPNPEMHAIDWCGAWSPGTIEDTKKRLLDLKPQ